MKYYYKYLFGIIFPGNSPEEVDEAIKNHLNPVEKAIVPNKHKKRRK